MKVPPPTNVQVRHWTTLALVDGQVRHWTTLGASIMGTRRVPVDLELEPKRLGLNDRSEDEMRVKTTTKTTTTTTMTTTTATTTTTSNQRTPWPFINSFGKGEDHV